MSPTAFARVLCRSKLIFSAPHDDELFAPHVRAASGLVGFPRLAGGRPELLAVVQDDQRSIAWIEFGADANLFESVPKMRVRASASDVQPLRFDDPSVSAKAYKMDLEAAVAYSESGIMVDSFLAFGSGSTAKRTAILQVRNAADANLRSQRWVNAERWYQALRSETDFSGNELNLEGAALLDDRLYLFQRGNGAWPTPAELDQGALLPRNAMASFALPEVLRFLAAPEHAPVPSFQTIQPMELGHVAAETHLPYRSRETHDSRRAGRATHDSRRADRATQQSAETRRWSFADACAYQTQLWCLLCAEASANSYEDGEVLASGLGVLGADGALRAGVLVDETGQLLRAKLEGICPAEGAFGADFFAVSDPDDPLQASELFCLKLC